MGVYAITPSSASPSNVDAALTDSQQWDVLYDLVLRESLWGGLPASSLAIFCAKAMQGVVLPYVPTIAFSLFLSQRRSTFRHRGGNGKYHHFLEPRPLHRYLLIRTS